MDRISEAGTAIGPKVRQAAVVYPKDLEAVFVALVVAKAGGLIVLPERAIMDTSRARIAQLALRHRIPTVSSFRMYVDAGGLLSYAQDLVDMHRRSATYVDKILKGARPAELPVEQPTKFELVINLKRLSARDHGATLAASPRR